MNVSKNISLFVVVFFIPVLAFSQTKFEKEYRIKKDEVPSKALQFLQSAETNFSEKWYYEENKLNNSVEAKLKYKNSRFSIEFDTKGNFQDIEIETKIEELTEPIRSKIITALNKSYLQHKIRKLQVQYSGDLNSFVHFLQDTNPLENFTVQYELIVKGKKKSGPGLYEITFNKNGDMVKTEQIIFRNTDNLEF